jgi:hypothetical protein
MPRNITGRAMMRPVAVIDESSTPMVVLERTTHL